jgi:hypothetical protein
MAIARNESVKIIAMISDATADFDKGQMLAFDPPFIESLRRERKIACGLFCGKNGRCLCHWVTSFAVEVAHYSHIPLAANRLYRALSRVFRAVIIVSF